MNRILVPFILFLLVGCSSMPPRTEVIHEALVTDAAMRSAVLQCATMSQEDRQIAEKERVGWWQRNGKWVSAADYGLLQLAWDKSEPRLEEHRALVSMSLLENTLLDAEDLRKKWLGDGQKSSGCQTLFNRVAKGKLDLDRTKKQKNVLEQLNLERVDVSEQAQAARSINARYRKYGRSLFVVEKELKQAGCSDPKVALLRNSWPIEVYDAVCSQQDYMLVKCEWGRCEVKR